MTSFDWALKKISKLASFTTAKLVLEIGAGSFTRSAKIASCYPDKQVFAPDFSRSNQAKNTIASYSGLDNFNPITFDCRENIFSENLFDFSFSIAVGEHIRELDVFLANLSKSLKPLGSYYFIQSPFWSSYKGHHYKHWRPEVVKVFGGYKHLIYDYYEMEKYLRATDLPSSVDVEDALFAIYRRGDLSRLSISATRSIIEHSSFSIKLWEPILDECYDPVAAKTVCDLKPVDINPGDLLFKGVIAELVNCKTLF